jgi:hypothetical protein
MLVGGLILYKFAKNNHASVGDATKTQGHQDSEIGMLIPSPNKARIFKIALEITKLS